MSDRQKKNWGEKAGGCHVVQKKRASNEFRETTNEEFRKERDSRGIPGKRNSCVSVMDAIARRRKEGKRNISFSFPNPDYRNFSFPYRRRKRPTWPTWSISCLAVQWSAPNLVSKSWCGRRGGRSRSSSFTLGSSAIACWCTLSNAERISEIDGFASGSASGTEARVK